MIDVSVDIAVLGSGFGGSLTALILKQIGRSVVLVDRASHPRFAIGESSTPIADNILADLADRYGLSRLKPLTKYGPWKATYPEIGCGLKRGFSYFHHQAGESFSADADHSTELLVAASSSDAHADTQWVRSDVDAFIINEARSAGVKVLEDTMLTTITRDENWSLSGDRCGEPVRIRACFVVDATGAATVIPNALGIMADTKPLRSNSRAVFGHFSNVTPWHDVLAESNIDQQEYPFPCDSAALHHILHDGWMWQLRFDDGITSAGLVFDSQSRPASDSASPDAEWASEIATYPSIAEQFEAATLKRPETGLVQTGRLQRCVAQAAGSNWVLLPGTAGFIDPLHSTGIAHTVSGVERIVDIIERHWNRSEMQASLRQYGESVRSEIHGIDRLVEGCYAARSNFRALTAWSMLYFAAATTCERTRAESQQSDDWSFLCAADEGFRSTVQTLRRHLDRALHGEISISEFEDTLRNGIAPFNQVGLCDPHAHNLYHHTIAPAR